MSVFFFFYFFGQFELFNCIVIVLMCQYLVEVGNVSDWYVIYFGNMLLLGVGLFVIEVSVVMLEGCILFVDFGLWLDEN